MWMAGENHKGPCQYPLIGSIDFLWKFELNGHGATPTGDSPWGTTE